LTLGFAQQFRGIKNLGIVLRVLRALGHPGLAAEAIEVCFLTNEVFVQTHESSGYSGGCRTLRGFCRIVIEGDGGFRRAYRPMAPRQGTRKIFLKKFCRTKNETCRLPRFFVDRRIAGKRANQHGGR